MMNKLPIALCSVLAASMVHAAEPRHVVFSHFDWELVCDNTGTCSAAGYQPEDQDDQHHYDGVTVLLTRAAGPNTPVEAELQVASADEAPARVAMRIDGKPLGDVSLNKAGGKLNIAQTSALLAAVRKDSDIQWTSGKQRWVLSSTGASAVLLKMDEYQGRIGTPGALVRKGTKAEAAVPMPTPVPVLKAARVTGDDVDQGLLSKKQRRDLLAELRRTLVDKDGLLCPDFDENAQDPNKPDLRRLSRQQLLVSLTCWTAAYNSADAYWVVNATPPYSPVLVTTNGNEYASGVITAYQRGRGLGDCTNTGSWTWDGSRFQHTESAISELCKGFPGGAWRMPSLTVKVVQQK